MTNNIKKAIDGIVEDIKADIRDNKSADYEEIELTGNLCFLKYGKEGYELFLEKLFNL